MWIITIGFLDPLTRRQSSMFVVRFFILIVLSDKPKQNQGQGLVDRKLVKAPPSNFMAGRPKAALLFWLFDDFRCSVSLFIVILVIYYSNFAKHQNLKFNSFSWVKMKNKKFKRE